MIRYLWHRLTRQPHDWRFWACLQDGQRPAFMGIAGGPKILIVERCAHAPRCRAVRSYVYESLIPDSVAAVLDNFMSRPNPYRTLVAPKRK